MINNPYGNIGKVENKGIEMSVSYANSWRDWSLSVMGNYSFNRNKVLEDDSTVAYPWQKTIGNKVDQRFGLIALGLFESPEEIAAAPVQVGDTRPGDIRYKDINGDGKIDEYHKVPIGWGSVPEIVCQPCSRAPHTSTRSSAAKAYCLSHRDRAAATC